MVSLLLCPSAPAGVGDEIPSDLAMYMMPTQVVSGTGCEYSDEWSFVRFRELFSWESFSPDPSFIAPYAVPHFGTRLTPRAKSRDDNDMRNSILMDMICN